MITEDSNTDNLLDKIKEGNQGFLKDLYEQNRQKFIKWLCWNYNCDEEDAKDAYQKSFSILYFNIVDEKITELKSGLETYLFGIGKNVIKKIFRSNPRYSVVDEVQEHLISNVDYFDIEEKQHQSLMVEKILKQVGDPCKTLLELYYFHRYSMESIATHLSYKNEGVVKKKKFLCLKKIREMLKSARNLQRGD